MVMRGASFFPFQTTYYLNGHSLSEQELNRARIGFDLEQQKRICIDLQKQLWEDVPFIPLGEYWQATAYRKDLTGVLPGCFTVFYGLRPAARSAELPRLAPPPASATPPSPNPPVSRPHDFPLPT